MNVSLISTHIIGITALIFTISLSLRNNVIDTYKTKVYIFASTVTIIILILEMIDILMQCSDNSKFIEFIKIIDVAGFSFSPLVPFILLLFNNKKMCFYCKLAVIPIFINALICIISLKTGWIFFFDSQNHYMRGNYFPIPTIVSMFYYILLIITIRKNDFEYDNDDIKFLLFVLLMPVVAIILQVTFNNFHLIWSSTSLSLLLYYIFLRELQFKYDSISGIKNREAFEKEMEKYNKNQNSAVIVVLDLNNLKKVNDSIGHRAGDVMIFNSAQIIKESFKGVGVAYRIGGDEFCVICGNASKEIIDNSLLKLKALSDSTKGAGKIVLAYGYAFYNKRQNDSIYDVFKDADILMYEHKAKLKGVYGRRISD